MSTNYYLTKTCGHCNHEERLHIGKSASGWCFALATHPEIGIESLDDWRRKFAEDGFTVVSEYEHAFTADEMLAIITNRSNSTRRSGIDGRHCIAHGPGPWDIMRGEFS